MKDKIICLCGSTRFKELFERVARQLAFCGIITFGIEGTYAQKETDDIAKRLILSNEKTLCKLHKRKIRLSNAIFVIDRDGYFGSHTASEIRLAKHLGKKVFFYSNNDLFKIVTGKVKI